MQASSICAFCLKNVLITDHNHNCDQKKLFSFITKMTQPKSDSFGNITNLVFQGGGVKGVAYLGALQQLQLERNNFLDGVKRIAGTSAGSIVALYLGLNMSVDEIKPLMERPYSSLLDEGLALKVKIDQAWYDTGVFGWIKKPFFRQGLDHLDFKAKHIVLHGLKYFEDWAVKIDKNPERLSEQEKELQEGLNKIFKYYGAKMGFLPQCAIKFKGSKYASDAARWLINLLHPPKTANANEESKTFDSDEGKNLSVSLKPQEVTGKTAAMTSNENYFSCTTESASNEYSHGVEQDYGEENAQGRQAEPVPFVSFAEKIDEESIASGAKTGADLFEEIINRECSGILSENDRSELSRADKFASFSSIKHVSFSHQSSFPSSLMSVLRNLTPDLPAEKHPGHFCHSNTGNFDKRSPNLEEVKEFSGSLFAKTSRKSLTPKVLGCSPQADFSENILSNLTQVEAPIPDGRGLARNGSSVEVLMTCGDVIRKDEMKIYGLNEISKEAANALQKEPCEISQKSVTPAKKAAAEEYIERKRDEVPAEEEEKLSDALLPAALGELLWFCIFSQQNAAGIQEQLGLFDGSVIKQELIEKPIMDSLRKVNLKPESDITFKELMDCKKFKQFYVTAFNTQRSKTEVFSAEHTPNVVIADAVRASMSIPVFFTPVTIREKYREDDKIIYREYLNGVKFMDGGILDNYPLWIFDDIKYCFDEDFKCGSNTNFSIQNPNTLGFRLLDEDVIKKYTNPNFISKSNLEEENQFKETFSYQIGLLLNAVANEAQENEHIKRGDYKRSVYVNNNGVSAIAFNLTDTEKNGLVESGKKAVKNYRKRAKKNFNGEGSTH